MRNKILTALLSIVIAFGLWLYVITVVSPGSEKTVYNIPVGVQGDGALADRGLCITNHPEETTVNLQLSGNRIDLNKVNNGNITITLNISNISEPGEYELLYDIAYPGEIASNAVTTQNRTPGTIKVVVEKRVTEKIPVVLTVTEADPGYLADVDEMEHTEFIWITGPERTVNKIHQAKLDIDLAGQHERIDGNLAYTLVDNSGNPLTEEERLMLTDDQAENGTIPVNLRVAPVKTIEVKANIKDGGGATKADAGITYSVPEITVSGNLQPLLEGTTVLPDIDLGKLTEQTNKFTLKLNLPPNVVCESGETEVEVEVSFPNLRTTELVISNFTLEGEPAGKEGVIHTKSLTVLFRGTKAAIDSLKTGDVTATVSFADGKEGTLERNVTIKVNGSDKVGAVGTYQVETVLKNKTASE